MNIERTLRRLERARGRIARSRLWNVVEEHGNAIRHRDLVGVRKVHVGCGPHNRMEGWHNVDIKPFDSVDTAMDVTKSWPFSDLDHIYSEHFLEHLELLDGVTFLERGGKSLRPGGRMRLSTPNLHWVMLTHFATGDAPAEQRLDETFKTNRAFHGWGHQFLYTEETLRWLLETLGYEDVSFHEYGKSEDPVFVGLERHGGYSVVEGQPSVIIAEATRGERPIELTDALRKQLSHEYIRFVEAS